MKTSKTTKRIFSLLLCALMVVSVFAACGSDGNKSSSSAPESSASEAVSTDPSEPSEGDSATGDLSFKGEISLMHYSTSEESEGNGGSDGFRTMIAEWKAANPDITLNETVLANDDYKTQIATLAAADDLPDVFLLQGMNTKSWSEQGLVIDMTDIIAQSPYAADYNEAYFTPFKNNDKIYGLPVLTGGTCCVVVYDKAAWKDAGYDSFPETWDEVIKANDYFVENGYIDTIAFGNSGQWQINSCFQSTIGDRFTGADWFQSIINKEGAAFTDEEFVDSLQFTKDVFASGIFNDDFNAINNEDAREYFISGDATAFIGGNWDVSYIQATLAESDEELYKNTGFAALPQPEGAAGSTKTQAIGLGYAVSISSKVENDADKLAAAVDFAYKVTGADFSKYVGENYALAGLTAVENIDLSAFDQFTQDFYNYSYVETEPCEIYDSYVSGAVWDVLNTNMQSMLNGDIEAEEVAKLTQESYEANY